MAQFSPPHLAALAVLCLAGIAAVATARRSDAATRLVAYALAAAILAAWTGEYVAEAVRDTWTARYDLPFQLTDAVSFVSILALLTRRRALVELTWFWALSASLQAALTPDLGRGQDFPSVFYFTYFGYHLGAIVAALMLVLGCGIYPRRGAVWRAFGLALGWAVLAGAADLISGANYMYLRFRPLHNSLLGLMGRWPWYILGGTLVGLAMLLALQWLADLAGRHDPRRARASRDPGPSRLGTDGPSGA